MDSHSPFARAFGTIPTKAGSANRNDGVFPIKGCGFGDLKPFRSANLIRVCGPLLLKPYGTTRPNNHHLAQSAGANPVPRVHAHTYKFPLFFKVYTFSYF